MVCPICERLSERDDMSREGGLTTSSRGGSEAGRRGSVGAIPEFVGIWTVYLDVFVQSGDIQWE